MTEPNLSPEPAPAAPVAGLGASTPRRVRIALAVSVALNLAVLGTAAGALLHGGPGDHGDMVRELGFGPFTEALGKDDRADLRKKFFAIQPDFRAERQRMQADSTAILAALRQTPFDPAGLDLALGAMESHITERLTLGSRLMADFLKGMTPEQRAEFANRLEASLRHGAGDGE
jgi:uncharacterized membrane protein